MIVVGIAGFLTATATQKYSSTTQFFVSVSGADDSGQLRNAARLRLSPWISRDLPRRTPGNPSASECTPHQEIRVLRNAQVCISGSVG